MGIFKIHEDLLQAPEIQRLLDEGANRKERFSDDSGYTEFRVEHPEFEEIGEGETLPYYLAYFTSHPDGTVTRDRIEKVK
jgi:hypothetical protein